MFEHEERAHNIDLCVDVDTQVHFLSGGHEDDQGHQQINHELIMVIFIMCLLVVVLVVITLAHYLIEKPRKERIRKQLGDFVNKFHNKNNHGNTQSLINSASSLNNNKESSSSLYKSTAGPIITISDYSNGSSSGTPSASQFNRIHSPSSFLERLSESEHEESDPLLAGPATVTTLHKVKFDIGEAIPEEETSPVISSSSKSGGKIQSDPDSNSSGDLDVDQKCLQSISHLLDDKPWMSGSQSGVFAPIVSNSRQSFSVLPSASSNARNLNLNE